MLTDSVFYLAFVLLLAHEVDAVLCREWRLLFVLRRLPEVWGRSLFVVLHVDSSPQTVTSCVAPFSWVAVQAGIRVRQRHDNFRGVSPSPRRKLGAP